MSAPTTTSGPPSRPSPRSPLTTAASWLRTDARADLPASLVVFLVAVPLSLGIAVASGAPVAAGLIAGIVGGILAGALGGSALQVSGPAAGLTVVVAESVAQLGWQTTCVVTIGAGLLQVLLGLSRVARFAMAISPTVVRGMLAGIGVSIVLGQLNVALGSKSGASAWDNLRGIVTAVQSPQWHAVIAAALVAAVLVAWPWLPPAVRVVPGPLVAIVGVTALGSFLLTDAARVELGGSLFHAIGLPQMPTGSTLAIAGTIVTVAVIASVESLLSAVAVDRMHDGPRARLDRELVGQGVANGVSGFLGGLPVTGVIVRSSTNVAAGARTRASAVLHGVWILVFSLLAVPLVEMIPLAALAGLLIVMGVQLVKPKDIVTARQRRELVIYTVTVVGVLAMNLVEGVMIGLALALVLVLWRVARARIDVRRQGSTADGRDFWIAEVHGTLTFLSTPRLIRGLERIPPGQVVEVDLLVDYLDPAGEEHLEEWRSRYVEAGGVVDVERAGPAVSAESGAAEKASPLTQRAWQPWSSWQGGHTAGGRSASAHALAHGVREFHRRTAHHLRPVFDELSDGQRPETFFLTCVDSRVVPNILTSSGPGDLLTVRTMGHLVPTAHDDVSVSAPLLYGIDILGLDTVVVCGHSGCGAMAALLEGPGGTGGSLEPVSTWREQAGPVLGSWREGHPVGRSAAADGASEVDQLAQVNVAVSVDRVRDLIGSERADRVRVLGMYFDIATGTMALLRDDRFVPLTDAELDHLPGTV